MPSVGIVRHIARSSVARGISLGRPVLLPRALASVLIGLALWVGLSIVPRLAFVLSLSSQRTDGIAPGLERNLLPAKFAGARTSSGALASCSPLAALADADVSADALINIAVNLALAGAIGYLLLQILGKRQLYPPEQCLPGRAEPIDAAPPGNARHVLLGNPLYAPFPEGTEIVMFGMGCFWCSENIFMRMPRGIHSTVVGYAGGVTPNPTYEEVCSGRTNHAEVVRVVYRPQEVSFAELLQRFWEEHDPTTENRQGNDFGTPYRSTIYCYSEEQMRIAETTRAQFQKVLKKRGFSEISTEICLAGEFYYAEGCHQQYDARGNAGYCGLRPTGASFLELPRGEVVGEVKEVASANA